MNKKSFYGIPLVGILGLTLFLSAGSVMAISSIANPLMLGDPEIQLSGTLLGTGFTVMVLMMGIPAPLIGQLVAKKGARFCIMIGGALIALGSLGMIFLVKTAIAYIICFGILVGLGVAMAGVLPCQTTVGNWWARKRGIAMTVAVTISALAGIIIPLVVNAVIGASGGLWTSGYWLYFAFGVLVIPLAFFFIKNKPADIGQTIDGDIEGDDTAKKKKVARTYQTNKSISYKETLRNKNFWLMALTIVGAYCGYNIATTMGVVHFTTEGFDRAAIVGAVSAMGIAALVGRFFIGALSDRIEPLRLISVCMWIMLIGIGIATQASSLPMVYAFYILIGLGFGSVGGNIATALANFFGLTAYPQSFGTMTIFQTVISSLIPLFAGAILDATGTCTPAFYAVGAVVLVCSILGFLVRIPRASASDVESEQAQEVKE